jgi:hypothetical protein
MYRPILCFLSILLLAASLEAQISEAGIPYSRSIVSLKSTALLPRINLENLDLQKLLEEDSLNPVPARYAIFQDTTIDIKLSGKADVIPGKGKIWRMRIGSDNAKSIQIIFKTFIVPKGATLFLYDDNQTLLAGSFSKNNMQMDSSFVLADFKGNHVVVEYFEPDNPEFTGKLIIGSISRAYKDIFTTQSASNYIGVNCPIGKDAQLEKHAVCKMTFRSGISSYLCTGSLINNTRQDGTPYFLTANHCISTSAEASTLAAYFNYENSGCNGDINPPLIITGSTLLSTAQPSDYSLLLLKNMPTSMFQPYYAGWDVNDSATNMVTGIHHPEGTTKKISIDYDSIYSNPVNISWEDKSTSPVSSHWVVGFDEGITGGGSSGSPLFNKRKQIIGQLHGGDSSMELYGKLSYSYALKPKQYLSIGHYIDPDSTGIKVIGGYSPPDNPPDAFFVTKSSQVCVNAPIKFQDYSVFGPYERIWSVTPSSYAFVDGTSETSPNPVIEFSEETSYTVKLDLTVSGIIESSESITIQAGNTLNVGINSKYGYELCDCDFDSIKLIASGAETYIWSIPVPDLNKIALNQNTGDTVIVRRVNGFQADSSYTINIAITGTQGTCVGSKQISFSLLKPPNDNIANAILLPYGRSDYYSNVCATIEEGEPIPPSSSCTGQKSWCDEYGTGNNYVENTVWFRLIASKTGNISISSTGFDNEIALYDAASYADILAGNYTLLAANDDRSATDPRPLIKTVNVILGKTYWIQVDGSGGGLEDNFYLTIVDLTQTGIAERKYNRMMVYPQPANNIVFLKDEELNKSTVSLSAYNTSGLCIFNKDTAVDQGIITLNITTWESGIYIIRINSGDTNYIAKIVKY